jgi:hypothetical protein
MKQVTKQQLESSIASALDILDEDTFSSLCDDGQDAILKMAKLIGFDIAKFAPEKEYTIEFASNQFYIPANDDIRNYTAKFIVYDKSGKEFYSQNVHYSDFVQRDGF